MAKSLVVCCDGTWNTADQKGAPTNVTKMARAIPPRAANGDLQVVYYDEGVGVGNVVERVVGGALGTGLSEKVQQAYRFFCLNYEPGDSLLMFGFSRGAYTVRSLAGLVSLVGLLRKGDLDQLPRVWEYYRTPVEKRTVDFIDRRWIDGRVPDIAFVGVWDTVGSLGIPGNFLGGLGRKRHAFHDVKLGKRIRHAYQALAIDERRKNFSPAIWDTTATDLTAQTVEQRWFAGAHSNIGGGYPDAVLSDIAFLWMCEKVRPLLTLDEDYIDRRIEKVQAGTARGALIDSATGSFWKLQGTRDRTLGADASEQLHDSAFDRYRAGSADPRPNPGPYAPFPYAPRNLVAYLKSKGLIP